VQGALFLGNQKVELHDFPDPEPGPGEVVVAIRASGMCGTDLHFYRSRSVLSRFIGGHEPAGVLAALGDGVPAEVGSVGDRVMVFHYSGCGVCGQCRSGWSQMCTTSPGLVYGTDAHGAHAPYMKVPAACVIRLDDALSFVAGAAIACGTGTAWGAIERLGDVGGRDLVVCGQGPVGLSATMLASARGARVIALDPEPSRRARALDFGAADVIDPTDLDTVAVIRELTRGRGAALGLETSGSSAGAASLLDSLAIWGHASFVGVGAEIKMDVLQYVRRQLTVTTSWSMSAVGMQECADFIVEHELPVDALFTHRWQLGQVVEAYEEFDKQQAGKAAIVFGA
jgi:threonine dehydrogenase-like Zn-dependent dehydrogenase